MRFSDPGDRHGWPVEKAGRRYWRVPQLIEITDLHDPRIEAYRDIRERDLVGRAGLFVAEGKVVIEKLVDSALHRPLSLLIANKRADALAPLLARLDDEVPVYVAGQGVIDAIAGFPLHRGMLAIGRRTDDPTAGELLADIGDSATVLVLCGIANHDNIGGIFGHIHPIVYGYSYISGMQCRCIIDAITGGICRNAAAFGVKAILLDADCCDPLYRKAIRVSVGATLLVPYARLARGEDLVEVLERHAFAPMALSPAGERELARWRPGSRTAVILGAEGPGLSAELMRRAQTVRIAMSAGFDSLNVATTSGIVLHHISASAAI